MEKIHPVLDAINVDLKAFRDETYKTIMKARLEPVLRCLRALVAAGLWVEVTTLIVPGMNDSLEELGDIAKFIAEELGIHVPWHLSRFHGDYKMTSAPSTPLETLQQACALGTQAGLEYIYCGNVPGQTDERTRCGDCDSVLIDRTGFRINNVNLLKGACPNCGKKIPGIWE